MTDLLAFCGIAFVVIGVALIFVTSGISSGWEQAADAYAEDPGNLRWTAALRAAERRKRIAAIKAEER